MERIMTGTVTQANFVGIVSMVAAENDGPRKLSKQRDAGPAISGWRQYGNRDA